MEHKSKAELQSYLRKHPGADASKHTVAAPAHPEGGAASPLSTFISHVNKGGSMTTAPKATSPALHKQREAMAMQEHANAGKGPVSHTGAAQKARELSEKAHKENTPQTHQEASKAHYLASATADYDTGVQHHRRHAEQHHHLATQAPAGGAAKPATGQDDWQTRKANETRTARIAAMKEARAKAGIVPGTQTVPRPTGDPKGAGGTYNPRTGVSTVMSTATPKEVATLAALGGHTPNAREAALQPHSDKALAATNKANAAGTTQAHNDAAEAHHQAAGKAAEQGLNYKRQYHQDQEEHHIAQAKKTAPDMPVKVATVRGPTPGGMRNTLAAMGGSYNPRTGVSSALSTQPATANRETIKSPDGGSLDLHHERPGLTHIRSGGEYVGSIERGEFKPAHGTSKELTDKEVQAIKAAHNKGNNPLGPRRDELAALAHTPRRVVHIVHEGAPHQGNTTQESHRKGTPRGPGGSSG